MGPQLTDKGPQLGQQVIKVRKAWKRRETQASGGDPSCSVISSFPVEKPSPETGVQEEVRQEELLHAAESPNSRGS